jgi:hypothetical protein
LIQFFAYLHDKKFEMALAIFDPDPRWWWWDVGEAQSPLLKNIEDMSILDSRIETSRLDSRIVNVSKEDKIKSLSYFCSKTSRCSMSIQVLTESTVAVGEYKFRSRFVKGNGDIFYQPRPYATDRLEEFDYTVRKINGVYKVVTPPLNYWVE